MLSCKFSELFDKGSKLHVDVQFKRPIFLPSSSVFTFQQEKENSKVHFKVRKLNFLYLNYFSYFLLCQCENFSTYINLSFDFSQGYMVKKNFFFQI